MNFYLSYISCLIKSKLTDSNANNCLYNNFSNIYKERKQHVEQKTTLGAVFK